MEGFGLTAGDDAVHAQILEHGLQARAGAHRNIAVLLLGRGLHWLTLGTARLSSGLSMASRSSVL